MLGSKFSDNLLALRKSAGLTQEELAQKTGLRQSHISAWERGEKQPLPDGLIKIADYFNCSVDYLLGRTDNKKIKK